MARWKIWVGLLVLFASGVLIGSVGTRMYVRHKISGMFSRDRPVIRDMFLGRLTQELDLTEEQREAVEQIASRTAEKFHDLRRQHRGEVEAILDQAVSEMKKHLSPGQQEQLDQIRKRMKAWHKWRRRGPPHPGPPPSPDMLGRHPPAPPPQPPAPR